jgi:hypothetical protein
MESLNIVPVSSCSRLDDQVSHIAKSQFSFSFSLNFFPSCLPLQCLQLLQLLLCSALRTFSRFEHSCRRNVTYLESSDQRSATNQMNLIVLSWSDRLRGPG